MVVRNFVFLFFVKALDMDTESSVNVTKRPFCFWTTTLSSLPCTNRTCWYGSFVFVSCSQNIYLSTICRYIFCLLNITRRARSTTIYYYYLLPQGVIDQAPSDQAAAAVQLVFAVVSSTTYICVINFCGNWARHQIPPFCYCIYILAIEEQFSDALSFQRKLPRHHHLAYLVVTIFLLVQSNWSQ